MELEQILEVNTNAAVLAAMVACFSDVHKNPHENGRDFVIVPAGGGQWTVEYLEQPDLPTRKSGVVNVYDVASLCEYANRHLDQDSSVIYARLDPAKFIAVLNDHGMGHKDATGWGDHRCVFDLKHSPEYAVWVARSGKPMTQGDFGEFIEANLPDFIQPQGAAMYELALNFRAKQEASYSGAIRTQSGDIELSYIQKTATEAVGATGKMIVPERFSIEIPVWAGLNQKKHAFAARLRYRLGNGTVTFTFDLDRPHKVVERAFEDVLSVIRDKVTAPVFFGMPQGT
jgi:uncharacterized protein YfdQ (DUF2303 family)